MSIRLEKKLVVAASMTGDVTSTAFFVKDVDNVGVEVDWTGTPTGTITFYGSNSATKSDQSDGTWFAVSPDGSAPANPAGSASGYVCKFTDYAYKFLGVRYAHSGSTGTLNVYAIGKGR